MCPQVQGQNRVINYANTSFSMSKKVLILYTSAEEESLREFREI